MKDLVVGDNALSSMRIPNGMRVTLFRQDSFRVQAVDDGGSESYSQDVAELGVTVPHDVLRYGGSIMLKSASTNSYLVWNAPERDRRQRGSTDQHGEFEIVRAGNTPHASMLAFGDVIALKAQNGLYVAASGTSSSNKPAASGTYVTDECKWTTIRSGAAASNTFVAQGDTITLKSVKYNRYLTVTGATAVSTSSTKLETQQRFSLQSYQPTLLPFAQASGGGPCGEATCGAAASSPPAARRPAGQRPAARRPAAPRSAAPRPAAPTPARCSWAASTCAGSTPAPPTCVASTSARRMPAPQTPASSTIIPIVPLI